MISFASIKMVETKNNKRPLILVTNDDGVTAPGILALVEAVKPLGRIVVVAPDKPQSGMGHAITINATLRINKVAIGEGVEGYSSTGTPVDCIKLAVNHILSEKPALVVSGINHGINSSINVIYSGTMSAAIEGALEGIPSIGFSLLDPSIDADFTAAKKIAEKLSKQVLKRGMPEGICLNVNIPALEESEMMGVKVCRQAWANWEEEIEARIDPSGKEYYWLKGVFKNYDKGTDTDMWALEHNYVSVVPVQFDMTAHHAINEMKKWKLE